LIFKYTNIGKRLISAIRDVSHIWLARLSKNLLFFKKFVFFFHIQSRHSNIFIFYNISSPFFLSILFKHYISYSVENDGLFEKGEILREWFIDQHIYAWICIDMLRYGGACIRSAASSRLNLAPYLPLAKISADP
jgi:hypothetical protein